MAEEKISKLLAKDTRTLAQLISMAENGDPAIYPILSILFPKTGRAQTIGITGPPGVGKSSLMDQLTALLRQQKKEVGILAVDPSSPLTGGAVLGDRIRLQNHFNDKGVFIRSLSSRGLLGGLSWGTAEAIHLIDAFGVDTLFVESVGVGQSETTLSRLVDLCVLVLVPEWGDSIQALKSGILETADMILINKAEREGADRIKNDLQMTFEAAGWKCPSILMTTQQEPKSYQEALNAIQEWFKNEGATLKTRREKRTQATLELLAHQTLERQIRKRGFTLKDNNPYATFLSIQSSLALK